MIVACPSCKAKFRIDESRIRPPGVRLRCARCQTLFAVRKRVLEAAPATAHAAAVEMPARPDAAPLGPKVLIAHESMAFLSGVRAQLEREGYEVLAARDGVEALMRIQRELPRAAVIDTALPKMYGFEICEFLKRNESLRGIKVVLVASNNGKARYKRNPENLYGADDFIEIYDVPHTLVGILRRLLSEESEAPGPAPAESEIAPGGPSRSDGRQGVMEGPSRSDGRQGLIGGPSRSAGRESLIGSVAPAQAAAPPERQAQSEEDYSFVSSSPVAEAAPAALHPRERAPAARRASAAADPLEPEREKARRLARIIVSDIALYNEQVMQEGIRNGRILEMLRDDLEEGYRLFRSRIPARIAEERDYVREALMAFIEKKRAKQEARGAGAVPPAGGASTFGDATIEVEVDDDTF